MATRIIVWLRNDLRLRDNAVLHEAVKRARKINDASTSGEMCEILPMYCFDQRQMSGFSQHGCPKTGAQRAKFQIECVVDLKERIKTIGSDLLITVGKPECVIRSLVLDHKQASIDSSLESTALVLTSSEIASEEKVAEKKVLTEMKKIPGSKFELVKSTATLYDNDDVLNIFGESNKHMPDVFTPFRNKVESRLSVKQPLTQPPRNSLPLPRQKSFRIFDENCVSLKDAQSYELDFIPSIAKIGLCQASLDHVKTSGNESSASAFPFKGGESQALDRLRHYLWDTDALSRYFETRNGMLGTDYSSKFSPFLAQGCISPRTIYSEVKMYEEARVENKSTYWLIFELIWRDFFRFFAMKHGNKIFMEDGIMCLPKHQKVAWRPFDGDAQDVFDRWCRGKTGFPLVDANMRELQATGFMSNRGRQNVASALTLDYGIDWRYGAAWFEYLLLDYDVCSNWGNWVAAAGMTGGRVNKFNIAKQSKDYDADGNYIKTWIPELRKVPVDYIHEPHKMPRNLQESIGVIIGRDYPYRISTNFSGSDKAYGIYSIQSQRNQQANNFKGRKQGNFANSNSKQFRKGQSKRVMSPTSYF